MDTIHACPEGLDLVTPCCGRSPHELMGDRMTLQKGYVNCNRKRSRMDTVHMILDKVHDGEEPTPEEVQFVVDFFKETMEALMPLISQMTDQLAKAFQAISEWYASLPEDTRDTIEQSLEAKGKHRSGTIREAQLIISEG